MDLQSVAGSPIMMHTDSMAILTVSGGFGSERTSTKCCFLMDFTATAGKGKEGREEREGKRRGKGEGGGDGEEGGEGRGRGGQVTVLHSYVSDLTLLSVSDSRFYLGQVSQYHAFLLGYFLCLALRLCACECVCE